MLVLAERLQIKSMDDNKSDLSKVTLVVVGEKRKITLSAITACGCNEILILMEDVAEDNSEFQL